MIRKRATDGKLLMILAGMIFCLLLSGCAARRGPVLYPNEHLKTVGDEQARRDIDECSGLAENYVKSRPGSEAAKGAAVGGIAGAVVGGAVGAVTGHLGRGVAIGAAAGGTSGLLHGAARDAQPDPVYKNFVDRCLREKGYEPIGWK